MRGRNRNGGGGKGPNPLSRSYESNGPDVKVRGTAAHIAEKYVQLARDAQSSGDPILAEAYLQHAEHYFRIIAAAQPQFNGQQAYGYNPDEDDDGEDGDFEGPIPSMPQTSPMPSQQGGDEQPRFHQRDRNFGERPPYNDRQGQGGEGERFRNERFQSERGPRPERFQPQDRPQDRPQERPQERSYDGAPNGFRGEAVEGERAPFQPRNRRERFRDRQTQERYGERGNGERQPYQERGFQPQPVVPIDQPQPDVSDEGALSALPSFITGAPAVSAPPPVPAPAAPVPPAPAPAVPVPAAPVSAAPPPAAAPAEPAAAPAEGEGEARPLRARRRRATPKKAEAAAEAGEAPAGE